MLNHDPLTPRGRALFPPIIHLQKSRVPEVESKEFFLQQSGHRAHLFREHASLLFRAAVILRRFPEVLPRYVCLSITVQAKTWMTYNISPQFDIRNEHIPSSTASIGSAKTLGNMVGI